MSSSTVLSGSQKGDALAGSGAGEGVQGGGGVSVARVSVGGSVYDSSLLLQELRKWKVETADRALQAEEGPSEMPWGGVIGEGEEKGADILELGMDVSEGGAVHAGGLQGYTPPGSAGSTGGGLHSSGAHSSQNGEDSSAREQSSSRGVSALRRSVSGSREHSGKGRHGEQHPHGSHKGERVCVSGIADLCMSGSGLEKNRTKGSSLHTQANKHTYPHR